MHRRLPFFSSLNELISTISSMELVGSKFPWIWNIPAELCCGQIGSSGGRGQLNIGQKLNTNSQVAHTCRLIAPAAIQVEEPLAVGLSLSVLRGSIVTTICFSSLHVPKSSTSNTLVGVAMSLLGKLLRRRLIWDTLHLLTKHKCQLPIWISNWNEGQHRVQWVKVNLWPQTDIST